jgi:hypothetical protein
MRAAAICPFLFIGSVLTAQAQIILPGPDPQIRRIILDENVTQRIPTFPKTTTTVVFPYSIEDASGVGFSKDPAKTRGDFYIKTEPHSPKIDVVPIDDLKVRTSPLESGQGRNLNVFVGGKVYVLEFFLAPTQAECVTKVVFVRLEDLKTALTQVGLAPGQGPVAPPRDVTRSLVPPKSPFQPAGAARVVGVLDQLKLISGTYGDTRQKLLAQMPRIDLSDRTERDVNNPGSQSDDTTDYDDFTIHLVRVIRNNNIDALGFEVLITNKTAHTIYFDPESFGVRVGENVFNQVTSDISPTLPANQTMRAWFAIITSPDGTPNYLSVDNSFSVLLTQVNGIGGEKIKRQPSRGRIPRTQPEGKGIITH